MNDSTHHSTQRRPATGSRSTTAGQAPDFIVVEGPIGVGKTSLAHRLADTFGYGLLLEAPAENPFLDRFYTEGRSNALPTQLYFLLQRADQLRRLQQQDMFGEVMVADYLMEKDRLFAELTLRPEELELYLQLYERITIEQAAPDLVVYLQAPAPVLLERIAHRGVPAEQHIEAEYLEALVESYTRFFHYYDAAPLLIVNAAEIDLVGDDEQYARLVDVICGGPITRSYFNPQPTLL